MPTVVIISDVHLHKPELPAGDILVGCGDYLNSGSLKDWFKFLSWIEEAAKPYKYCILTGGNHDWAIHDNITYCKQELKSRGIDLLIDEELYLPEFGISLYGTPHVNPINGMWAWEKSEFRQEFLFSLIKFDPRAKTKILISHSPVHGILDNLGPLHLGSKPLLNAVLKKKPDWVLHGHIHSAYGQREFNGIKFVNAAICTELYLPDNPIQVIEV
jgi:Icc-related predicted phosphoesterase